MRPPDRLVDGVGEVTVGQQVEPIGSITTTDPTSKEQHVQKISLTIYYPTSDDIDRLQDHTRAMLFEGTSIDPPVTRIEVETTDTVTDRSSLELVVTRSPF